MCIIYTYLYNLRTPHVVPHYPNNPLEFSGIVDVLFTSYISYIDPKRNIYSYFNLILPTKAHRIHVTGIFTYIQLIF